MPRLRPLALGLLASAIPLLGMAAVADAATLTASGNVVTYTAAPGEQNTLTVNWGNNPSAGSPTFGDYGAATVQLGPGCQEFVTGTETYNCPVAGRRPIVVVRLGDGNDRADSSNSEAAGQRTEIYGEDGNDRLMSGAGSDLLDGGNGDDELQPDDEASGPGDVLVGGPGKDFLQLVDSRVPALTATLDGVADDGAPGENDNYGADLEDVQGSRSAANRIVGTDGPNVITILQDAETLGDNVEGRGGDDTIETQGGPDRLDGGDGNDKLLGGSGDDVVIGGGGIDSMDGDSPTTYGVALAGNDRIEARDGNAEQISCGGGADVAIVDANDLVPSDPGTICESVDRATIAPAPIGGGGPAPTGQVPGIRSSSLRVKANRLGLSVACPAGPTSCRGTAVVKTTKKVKLGSKRKTVTVVKADYVVQAGKRKTVSLKLTSDGRSLVRRTRSVKVKVELRPRGSKTAAATKTVTLRR